MAEIKCFLIEPTDRVQRYLRRYALEGICPLPHGYHDASVLVDTVAAEFLGDRSIRGDWDGDRTDSRFPEQCDCGYAFTDADQRQHSQHLLWRRSDTGELITLREAPPGAMYFAYWHAWPGSSYHVARGGGPHLRLMTPGGEWDLDSKASNGDGWEWSGTPPNVTTSPSIIAGEYHGWLRGGILHDA